MPLVRISLLKGHNEAAKHAMCEGVYDAMREVFNVPADDKFVVMHEHGKAEFVYAKSYLGVAHDDGLVIVQITCNEGRSLEMKKALYASIADKFEAAGVARNNVFISLVEVKKENWSFGDGIAQYA